MKISRDLNQIKFYSDKYFINSKFSKSMLNYMEIHEFKKGEIIYTPGDEMKYFYFLVEGKLKVCTMLENGKNLLLRFYKPLSIMGDLEMVLERVAGCYLEVLWDVKCIAISYTDLEIHAENDPIFLKFLLGSLGQKVATCSKASAINLMYPLENRLASYILAVTPSEFSSEISINEMFAEKLTDMADLLGTSYRHLLRVINDFESKGIIKREKKSFTVLDRKALIDLSGDLY